MRAVRFIWGEEGAEPVKFALETGSEAAFVSQVKSRGVAPAAYVVRNDDLDVLRQFGGAIIDRGTKHKSKALGHVLLGYDEVPLIAGSYTKVGQLIRSVRTLLENALEAGDQNAYLIGASSAVFGDLWRKAVEEPQVPLRGDDTIPGLVALRLSPEIEPDGLTRLIRGQSGKVRLFRQLILRAGQRDEPVLILGENGAGKGLAASAIHQYGCRSARPYKVFNCATMSRELLEQELFGVEGCEGEGAGAAKLGMWEIADEGTMLLHGIDELTLDDQRKILRAVEDGMIRRVGASGDIEVSARVIAATSRDLHAMVEYGQFRQDLYYLLRRFVIRVPALRDRPEDIPFLARQFWRANAGQQATLSEEVIAELQSYGWPGNVAELKSVLANLYALFEDSDPGVDQLRSLLLHRRASLASTELLLPEQEAKLHWIRCLQHLRRVGDVIGVCEHGLRQYMAGPKIGAPGVEADLESIGRHLVELDELCDQPLLFHSEATFRLVHEFQGKLAYLYGLIRTSRPASREYWEETVFEGCGPVRKAIERELERAVGGG